MATTNPLIGSQPSTADPGVTTQSPTVSTTTTQKMDPQTNCRLMKLPRELRDMIYEYTFTPNKHNKVTLENLFDGQEDYSLETIDLDTATQAAPPVALALTCQLFHQEAVDLHQAAYQSFWSGNVFSIEYHLTYDHSKITRKNIQHIRHITIDPLLSLTEEVRVHLKDTPDKRFFPWHVFCESSCNSGYTFAFDQWISAPFRFGEQYTLEDARLKKEALNEVLTMLDNYHQKDEDSQSNPDFELDSDDEPDSD